MIDLTLFLLEPKAKMEANISVVIRRVWGKALPIWRRIEP